MSISVLIALMATLPAESLAVSPAPVERYCVTGFCPVPNQNRMPGGLMYLAIGLVWVGVAGLRREGQKKSEPHGERDPG